MIRVLTLASCVLPAVASAQLVDVFWRGAFSTSFPPATPATLSWEVGPNWSTGTVPGPQLITAFPTYPLGSSNERVVLDAGFQPVGASAPFAQGFGGTIEMGPFAGPEREVAGLAMTRAVLPDPDGSLTGESRPDSLTIDLNGRHLYVRPAESTYPSIGSNPAVDPGTTLFVSADGTDLQPIARLVITRASIGAELEVRDYGQLRLTSTGVVATPISIQTPTGIRGLIDSTAGDDALAILTLDDYRTTGLYIPSPLTGDPGANPPTTLSPAVLRVGESGHGRLVLDNSSAIEGFDSNGAPTLTTLYVGGNANDGISSTGLAELEMANDSTILAEDVYIGDRGSVDGARARVDVTSGSRLQTTDEMVIARSSVAEVFVSRSSFGSDSELDVGTNLFIGLDGPDDTFGAGSGLLDVRGSRVSAGDRVEVGVRGNGTARFGFGPNNDGTSNATLETPILTVGTAASAVGEVDFQGGSDGFIATFVEVGKTGEGTFIVGDAPGSGSFQQASVEVGNFGGAPFPPRFNVAVDPGSTGRVVVRERGSLRVTDFDSSTEDAFILGRQGTATLEVVAGGYLQTERSFIGETSSSQAGATVRGQYFDGFNTSISTWNNSGDLYVGYEAPAALGEPGGRLTLLEGATVSTGLLSVGTEVGGNGRVDIGGAITSDGPDTTGFISTTQTDPAGFSVVVGRFGRGEVYVTEGSLNSNTRSAIGTRPGGSGRVEVDAGGQFLTNGALLISAEGGGAGTGYGRGELVAWPNSYVEAGETTLGLDSLVRVEGTGQFVTLNSYTQLGGRTELDQATLLAGNFEFTAGVLAGAGTLGSSGQPGFQVVFGPDFEVAPGFSPGTLLIDGPVDFLGTYTAELGGGTTSDLLSITGSLTLDPSSELTVGLFGPAPTPGTSYTLVTYTGGRTGEFGSFTNLTGLPLEVIYGPAVGAGFVAVTVIPEPATWTLLGALAALAAAGLRRRR